MKKQLTRLYRNPNRNRWYALDDYGWSLYSSDKPSIVRKFRHLYRAYMTVSTDKEADAIIAKIQAL